MKYAHVARWLHSQVWAIYSPKLDQMMAALDFLCAGGEYSAAEIAAIVGAARKPAARPQGGNVAVLPLWGVIAHRGGMLTDASGGTSTDVFAADFRGLVADPEIEAIALDVHSPGGTVTGVAEVADEIYQARAVKPVVAMVDAMAGSAAYWIASMAAEISVTPTGQVGSIGVFTTHRDLSGAMEQAGVKTTMISAGRFKTEGNPYEPLSEEARAAWQKQVDEYYGMFTRAVARGRGVTVADVRSGFGQGRMVLAKDALAAGMVDRIETMDEMMSRLMRQEPKGRVATVAAKIEEPSRAKIEEPRPRVNLERERLRLLRLRV